MDTNTQLFSLPIASCLWFLHVKFNVSFVFATKHCSLKPNRNYYLKTKWYRNNNALPHRRDHGGVGVMRVSYLPFCFFYKYLSDLRKIAQLNKRSQKEWSFVLFNIFFLLKSKRLRLKFRLTPFFSIIIRKSPKSERNCIIKNKRKQYLVGKHVHCTLAHVVHFDANSLLSILRKLLLNFKVYL